MWQHRCGSVAGSRRRASCVTVPQAWRAGVHGASRVPPAATATLACWPSCKSSQVVQVCAEHKKPAKLAKHLQAVKARSAGMRNPPRILIFANRIKVCAAVCASLRLHAGYPCTCACARVHTCERLGVRVCMDACALSPFLCAPLATLQPLRACLLHTRVLCPRLLVLLTLGYTHCPAPLTPIHLPESQHLPACLPA